MTAPLSEVVSVLEQLAPLEFAEPWDNVGLLLEPTPLAQAAALGTALLTIDLTDEVLAEADVHGAGLIIAYHPPIFQGLKRLRASQPSERTLLGCIARRIAVYSPHTALDAAPDGVNAWLAGAFADTAPKPCAPSPLDERFGQGRSVRLDRPISLTAAVDAVKARLGLAQLRVAVAPEHAADAELVQSVAVCAGAGGSLFEKLVGYDLFVTGEMRHHDVLARKRSGSSVILSEHTHTERGFLPVLAERLRVALKDRVHFEVSQCDRDPLALR